jgi:transketolase
MCFWTCIDIGSRTRVGINYFVDPRTTFVTTLEDISTLTQPRHPDDWADIDSAAVDTVRVLAADAVQKVGNGHPGTAMSLAPLAYTLFQRAMRHDPNDTTWLGRDRFVLSAGHSSLTLYIQLYLGGFGLELSDIESLRTWGSKTPGHPEFRHTRGVEMTTGPLGQGLASAVGMAMASRYERGLFDPDAAPGTSPFDHYIFVIASDGDIEEGVTSEASSLAAVQELGNLIVFYDHNQISIEDDTNIALCEDTAARYEAYGWHVQRVEVLHRVADHHRLSGAQCDEHREGARLSSRRRRGGGHQENSRIRSRQEVRGP